MGNIRDLAFLGASFSVLYNLSDISFLPNEAIKMESSYQKYLALELQSFYIPSNLVSLLNI